jgi:limonene-1,2-epoxide hydrolase
LFVIVVTACTPAMSPTDAEKLRVANEMVQAWNELDWDRVFELFAEDGVLHSMMREPIVGRETIREHLGPIISGLERIELQIVNMGIVNDVVMIERVDDFGYRGKHSRLPTVGVLVIADGKVQEWRDYYDRTTLVEALSGDEAGDPADEVLAVIEKMQEDWNRADMAGYLDAYRKDGNLTLSYGDNVIRGWQVLSDLFNEAYPNEEKMGKFRVSGMSVAFPASDMAVVTGQFEHQFTEENIIGAFSHVLQRSGESRWEIIHEHTSRGQVIGD